MHINHPVFITLIIILQRLIICVTLWITSPTAWIAYTLFLIFIGGLIVLFIYTTSLASNEKIETSVLTFKKIITLTLVITVIIIVNIFSETSFKKIYSLKIQIEATFSWKSCPVVIIIISYLLFTLIVIVKTADKIEGPLRNIIKLN